ncbi:motile sperm domain-containing protein 1-like isoform X2 [Lineus longissimus]
MHSVQPPTLIDGKLPVFVFPSSLNFFIDDQSTHKQVLTVYNPYDFTLKFKVLCTSPKKYMVVDSEGVIKSRCCIDIVIRHLEICGLSEGLRDKFRIHIYEHGKKKVIGKKDIIAMLLPTRDKNPPTDDNFEALPSSMREDTVQRTMTSRSGHSTSSSAPSLIVIIAAVTCILALMLPNYGDTETRLPDYMLLTQNQKLIAAYVLGLVTMVLLRT